MRTVVFGSRDIKDYALVAELLDQYHAAKPITELIEGGAVGVDAAARHWAIANKIPHRQMPAEWNKYGPSAGPVRNRAMAAEAERGVGIWDGRSRGTKNMVDEMQRVDKPVLLAFVECDADGKWSVIKPEK